MCAGRNATVSQMSCVHAVFGQELADAGQARWVRRFAGCGLARALPGRVRLTAALAVAVLGAFSAPALAQDVLVSNTGQTSFATDACVGDASGTTFTQGFRTGDNPGGYTLSAVGITLGTNNLSGTESFNLFVHGSNSGRAGDRLHTLTPPSPIATGTIVDFTAPADATLVKETDYHVVFAGSGDSGDVCLKATASNIETGESGWTIEDGLRLSGTLDTGGISFQIRVKGSENNAPAIGDPLITGTARVGETLAVDISAIADPDGLPSTLTYQWIRVDGGVETDISPDATSATYTLVAADGGKKVKVRVSFTDDGGTDESRTSAAYPSSGAVVVPPGPPASLTAEAGDGRVRLVWEEPADENSPVGYQIRHAAGASVPAETGWTGTARVEILTALVSGLTNGTAHTFEVRAVRGNVSSPPASVSATPVAAVCSAPAVDPRRQVWSGTMTVGHDFERQVGAYGLGENDAGFEAGDFGSLSVTPHFSIGATRYDISEMIADIRRDGERRFMYLTFSNRLPNPVKAALRLHSCGETRDVSSSSFANAPGGRSRYRWIGRSLAIDFSLYPTREIALSLPANNAATGEPAIVSDIADKAHVGRTLTASAGTVADDDGLPSALTYQWYRVDGSNSVETEIGSATTYTPTAADIGHTLKVKALFQDDLGGVEERESVETPTVEQPTLTIAEASATEGSALSFAVTLSPATDRPVTVNWAVSTSGGNTASANDLSGTTSGSLTFAANETSKTITVSTVQDEVYEGNETFTVTLSGPASAVLGTASVATGTITNDEALPTMTLVLADDTIRESDDPDQPGYQHRTTVTATLDIAIEGDLRISVASGPALRIGIPADLERSRLTIRAGQKTSETLGVVPLDNTVDEPDRMVVLEATSNWVNSGYLDQTTYPQAPNPSLTIIDDDEAPTVTLALSPASIRESDDAGTAGIDDHVGTVTASLSHPSSEATTVTVSAAAVGAAVSGDFTLSGNRVLTIPARQTRSTGTVTVSANDNNVDAADKQVAVSGAAANTQGIAGNPPDQTLTIRDDEETPRVALVLGAGSISENAGSTTVKATIPYPSSHETVVTISAAPGDFTASVPLTIPAGQTESPTATLTAVDNETDAPDRQVTVNATAVNGHGIVPPVGVLLTITDDDPAPEVTMVLTPDSIGENGGSTTVTATLDRRSSNPTTVTVSAAAVDPAVAGDFTLTGATLTIAEGQTASTGTVTIMARNNDTDAPDKQVRVSGTAVNTQGADDPQEEVLTIEDDDPPPAVMLTLSKTAADENDGAAIAITASLSRPSSEETTVTVSAAAVVPAVDTDFTLSGTMLTISAGQKASTGTVTIVPVDNETDAPDKEVAVSATVDNTQGYELGTPADVTLTIRDDDPAPVATLVLMPGSIGENGGVSTVTAKLDRPSSEDTTVGVSAAAVSPAVAGDFTLSGSTLTISAGSQTSTGTVTIEARDNNVDAPDKQVTVSATASNSQGVRRAVGATAGTTNVALADATLTVEDDDPAPTVTLALADTAIRESDDAGTVGEEDHRTTVTATLSHPSSEQTMVTITPAVGDFTLSAGGRLTIPALATASTGSVTLTAVDDDTDAPDKALKVLATAANTQGIEQPDPVDLTIADDEPPPTVTLELSRASINEASGSSTVTARLSHPSSEATTVTVAAAAVSPALAADFTISGTVLTVPAGVTGSTSTATIRAVNNMTDAPDKQVTVSATVDNTQGYEAGTPADVVLTIADDEPPPTVTLTLSSVAVTENGGEAAVTALLSHPSSEATVVTVSTAAVSPAVVADFAQTGTQLTVPAGLMASTGTVTIAANDNKIDTTNRRVTVSGTAANGKLPAPGVAGNPPDVTLTIADDDERGIAFSPATQLMVEGLAGAPNDAGYTIALTAEPTGPVTVTVSGASGLTVATASSPQDSDFGTSKTLSFTASNWDSAQAVTLRAGPDGNSTDDTYRIRHTASGSDYGSVSGNLSVRVLDVNRSGATLALTVDRAEIAEGGGAALLTVTAALGGSGSGVEPDEYTVVLSVAAGTASSGDFASSEVSFEIGGPSDYSGTFRTTKTIAITPVDDGLDEDDETVSVTATATPTETGVPAATIVPATVTILDDDTRGVTVAPVQLELDEGGSRGYTVTLDSQPTGNVTVTPSKSGDADITFPPASLTFTDTNWDTAQTVTVSAAEDGDPLDDQATISHAVSGADYGSNNVRAAPVQATARDNDGRGVNVSSRDLIVAEGGTETYAVWLNSKPTGTVTIRPVATGDPGVSAAPERLSFTALNWDTEQTVTVSAARDADIADDRASISHAVSGADYGSSNVPGPEVLVRATDSGETTTTGTITVSQDTVREASGTRAFTVTATLGGTRATATVVTVLMRGGTASVEDFTATPSAFQLVIPSTDDIDRARAQKTIGLFATRDDVDEEDETILVEGSAPGLTFTNAEVTITDDDTRDIVVSRTSAAVTEEGRDASYTVRLGSQPTGAVTVMATVTGDDDVTVTPSSLSFTASDWNRVQTVTVQAGADPDGDNETATVSHAAAGADYEGLAGQSVTVSVTDDDEASRRVTLSLSPDRVDEDAGSPSVTVTAALDGAARASATEVQVTVTGNTAQALTDFAAVQPFTVTIPEGDASATGTFDFAPVDDSIDEGDETVTVGGTVGVSGLSVVPASLLLVDDDDRGVTASLLAMIVDEEGSRTYTLVLDTQPTGDVTVRPSVSGNRDVTVLPASLIFTVSNWDTAQEVAVSAAADDDAVNDTATVGHAARGADYAGVRVDEVEVTVRDNDERGVTVDPVRVQLREGGRETYTVVLETQPTGTVTIRPSLAAGSDGDVRVSPSALSFSTSNWKTPKTVTVSAGQDGDSEQDSATVEHAVSGADYGEVAALQVSVTVTDDDVPSTAIMLRLSTNIAPEGRSRTQITVTGELDGSPAAAPVAVVLDLEVVAGGAQEGVDFAATQPVTLTIAAGRTSATAQVVVTPVSDRIDEGAGEALQLVAETTSGLALRPSSSFDLTIEDDDEVGIVLSRNSLTVREEGRGTYTVRLNSQPTAPVTLVLAAVGTDAGDLTVRPMQLSFTGSDWNTAQTVTVSGAEDPDGDDDSATIAHTASGGGYGSAQADLPVTVDDIDQTSRTVQLSLAPDWVDEDAGSKTVTVTAVLDGAARSTDTDVAVQATGGTALAVTDFADIGTVTVTIPAGDPEGTQTFSFSPVDDSIDEGLSETVILGGTVQGLSVRTATLTIADNDGKGIELSQGPVTLREEDRDGSYTVALATQPTGTVTVRVSVSGNPDVTADPGAVAFTASNWQTPQTVTVRAEHDDDAAPDTAQLNHSASGADYGGVRALALAVEIEDNDERGVTVSQTALEFREGGRASYTVMLDTQPTGTVTVTPTVTGDVSIRVSPSSLAFTRSNWKTPKTVTVSADQDLDQTADSASIAHAVSGADYGEAGVTAAGVEVRVSDDDIPSTEVRLSLSANSVPEGAGARRLTVTAELNAAPETADTVMSLTLEAGTAEVDDFAAFGPVTLTIPAGQSRATAQVTVDPVRDAVDEDDETVRIAAAFTSRASGSALAALNPPSLEVTITDDDERGVTVTPTALSVLEGGTATYTVKLNSAPTDAVTVTPTATSTGTRTVTADPSSLTFTANDWEQAQTVTLSTNNDDMVRDDATATVAHSASGGDYGSGSVTIASVDVTVPGLVIVGMKVTIRIPMDGIVLVPEGTPVPSGIRLVLPVGLAGQRVSLSPGALPANTPRGFRAGNALVDIELEPGATLSGEATVCLPSQGRGRVFRWDEAVEPPVWVELVAPPAGSPPGLACGTTEQFALFALGSAQQDRIAKAWLARFGRTAAQHVTDAVQDRLGAPRAAGFSGTLAGQPLPAPGTVSPGVADTGSPVQRLDVELTGTGDGPGARSVVLTPRDLLTGSRFSLTTESEDGASFAVWGRGAVTGFDSRDGEASVEGHVSTGLVGADVASGPLVAGLALSLSEGRGTWTLDGEKEDVKSSMTGLHPFVGYELSKRLSVWGVAGYGRGELETSDGTEKTRTEIDMTMAAAGANTDLLSRADGDSLTLSLKTDGLFVRIGADAAEGIDKVKADASRIRIALEGSLSVPLSDGGGLEPSLELGIRHDGGDAETGFGVDIGAGLGWTDPVRGLKAEVRARGLLTHDHAGFRERGFSGSFAWQQNPSSDRGAMLSLSQTVGGPSSGGVDALLSRTTLDGLAESDIEDGGSHLDSHRLEAKFGYGFSVFGDRFTWTPEIGIGLSDTVRDYGVGWRLSGSGGYGGGSLDLSFKARRRESANDGAAPEHAVGFLLNARF